MGSGQQQGSEGYKYGNLKRQLESVPIAEFTAQQASSVGVTLNQRLWLIGLNGNLKVMIACGVQSDDQTSTPFPYPANPGTIQLYPCTKFGDTSSKVFLRPVFQDPTNVLNVNAPLPQEIPFGWEAQFTEVDQVMIEVIINTGNWSGSNVTGTVVVQVTVEYNGAWWDIDAIEYAMGQVQLTGAPSFKVFGTGGA